ncbi:MAG: HAD-IB family phosphatase, partial [Candidatus Marinimicrobia bacterium]|nr:HAD-IB family phosphatase [Candidatus Neomarinimicrobiota bacterium]
NVINLLKETGRNMFILTGGLQPAVNYLARYLGIGYKNVYSVEIYFNQEGEYTGFDKSSPLVNMHGKAKIAKQITEEYGKSVLIGDGQNDIEAASELELFIGYGGAVRRQKVLEDSEIYIECNSFAPIIPILMDEEEMKPYRRKGQYPELIERGLNLLSDSVVRK